MNNYAIFDDLSHADFLPLTHNRAIGDLRVGILKLRQRLIGYFELEDYTQIVRRPLEAYYEAKFAQRKINRLAKSETIFINSRLVVDDGLVSAIRNLPMDSKLVNSKNQVAAFRKKMSSGKKASEDLPFIFSDLQPCAYEFDLWENIIALMSENNQLLKQDFYDFFYEKDNYFETEPGVTILNPYDVWLGEDCELKPGVVIDASEGPVVIDEGAKIMPNSVIMGPAYIGRNSLIKAGAKIYGGTSVGPVCKIGGEVEESIILGYSNKQHDGFLGHSYLGEWVNIGADTNNSDLKNNYKNVKIYNYAAGEKMDTGKMFVGCVIGDHAKLGINSSINTGTVIGLGANIYGRDLISGFIPDFSWGEANNLSFYRLADFLITVEAAKARRRLAVIEEEKALYKNIAAAISGKIEN